MCASGNKPARASSPPSRPRLLGLLAALLCCGFATGAPAADLDRHKVEDLDYGRALYYYFQDNELTAITRLMIADESPRQRKQRDESNLLLADLYYGYGLYEKSRDMFARLLNAEVSDSVQNRIWFNLAKLRYEQGYHDQARQLLARISDTLPPYIEAERKYLLTNLLLENHSYDEAADLSNRINPQSIWKIYARYNLAVALIEDKSYDQGRILLEKIGQMTPTDNSEVLSLRDRANLSLGLKQLRLDYNQPALESLSRIRLEGPLSHEALLSSGWAWQRLKQPDKALVPWSLLLRRNAVDAATQEAILAIPSSYAELGQDALALRHFEIAARQFNLQLEVLDDAIESIRNDGLIAALRENAILFDRSSLQRLPPSSDVTPQLHLLLASSGFQREIRRYQQLLDIRSSLRYWGNSFPALELMLDERRLGFRKRLPKLQESTDFERLEKLKARRNEFARQVYEIESTGDYLALARPDEQDQLERLERVEASIGRIGDAENIDYQQDMLRVFSGLLNYQIETEFPARFWKAKKQLILLDRAIGESEERARSLRQIVERSELEFDLFEQRIAGQVDRIRKLRSSVAGLLKRQEQHINDLAIEEIERQQKHIVELRLNARFELARLYDKMAAEQ
jgi:hypothetical protein